MKGNQPPSFVAVAIDKGRTDGSEQNFPLKFNILFHIEKCLHAVSAAHEPLRVTRFSPPSDGIAVAANRPERVKHESRSGPFDLASTDELSVLRSSELLGGDLRLTGADKASASGGRHHNRVNLMLLRRSSKSGIDCRHSRSALCSFLVAAIAWSAPSAAMLLTSGPQAGRFNWSNELATRFDTVGEIQCHDPANPSVAKTATGWIVGSTDTVVTAAHLFFQRSRAGARDKTTLSPTQCTFRLYDGQGALRDVIGFRYGLSEWVDVRRRYDSSYDVAVLKLDRRAAVRSVPAVKILSLLSTPTVKLAAFHGGSLRSSHPWLTSGQTKLFPSNVVVDHFDDMRISDTRRMLAASADSTPGSSGGMYFDPARNAAIGIHVGSLCAEGQAGYNVANCFNYGLRFDAKLLGMIDSVVSDRPLLAQLIRPR